MNLVHIVLNRYMVDRLLKKYHPEMKRTNRLGVSAVQYLCTAGLDRRRCVGPIQNSDNTLRNQFVTSCWSGPTAGRRAGEVLNPYSVHALDAPKRRIGTLVPVTVLQQTGNSCGKPFPGWPGRGAEDGRNSATTTLFDAGCPEDSRAAKAHGRSESAFLSDSR